MGLILLLGAVLVAVGLGGTWYLLFLRVPSAGRSSQAQLPLASIEDQCAVLRDGTRVAVLSATGVNFALSSESEQLSLLAGYAALVNALDHPLQILLTSAPADADGYIEQLAERSGAISLPGLEALAADHERFVRSLVADRRMLDRRCYLVVPSTGSTSEEPAVGWLGMFRRGNRGAQDPAAARRILTQRCNALGERLREIGAHAHRLDGAELATLWRHSAAGLRPPSERRLVDPAEATPVLSADPGGQNGAVP